MVPTMTKMLNGTMIRKRSEEHTSELQSQSNLVCRLLLEKKNTLRDAGDSFRRARRAVAHLVARDDPRSRRARVRGERRVIVRLRPTVCKHELPPRALVTT